MLWREALSEFDRFVAEHPEIAVSRTGLAIPQGCRAGFYDKVDDVRLALAREVVRDGVPFAMQAACCLRGVTSELAVSLGLDEIVLPSALQAFCDDPHRGASQSFRSALLSYVQGVVSADDLLEDAQMTMPRAFDLLSSAAYEAWVVYAAVLALRPLRAYEAVSPDAKGVTIVPARRLELGMQQYSVTLRLPEAVFECPSGVYGLKFELASEIDFYASRPERRRDYSSGGDTHGVIGRRYALLYRFGGLEAVPFLADRDREFLVPPTEVIGALRRADFRNEAYCAATIGRMKMLSPTKGARFALAEAPEDGGSLFSGSQASVRLVETGFDESAVALLVEPLLGASSVAA